MVELAISSFLFCNFQSGKKNRFFLSVAKLPGLSTILFSYHKRELILNQF